MHPHLRLALFSLNSNQGNLLTRRLYKNETMLTNVGVLHLMSSYEAHHILRSSFALCTGYMLGLREATYHRRNLISLPTFVLGWE